MGDTVYLPVALSLKHFGTVIYNETAAKLTNVSYSFHCISLLTADEPVLQNALQQNNQRTALSTCV